jgi:hypothetical protein
MIYFNNSMRYIKMSNLPIEIVEHIMSFVPPKIATVLVDLDTRWRWKVNPNCMCDDEVNLITCSKRHVVNHAAEVLCGCDWGGILHSGGNADFCVTTAIENEKIIALGVAGFYHYDEFGTRSGYNHESRALTERQFWIDHVIGEDDATRALILEELERTIQSRYFEKSPVYTFCELKDVGFFKKCGYEIATIPQYDGEVNHMAEAEKMKKCWMVK